MRGSPRAWSGVFAVCLLAGLTACSDEPHDPQAVDQWLEDNLPSADTGEVQIAMSGQSSAGSTREESGHSGIAFEDPITISGVEFSCYGEGSMTLGLEASVEGNRETTGITTEMGSLDCAESPHVLEAGLFDGQPLGDLTVRRYDSDADSAWIFTVPAEKVTSN